MAGEKLYARDFYGKALVELGGERDDIVVLDADLSSSTRTAKFAEKFPHRFFDMGVAEQNMMGVASGLAACGNTVFASTFAMFASGRAWEQVRNTIAANKLNVKIVATHAGITVGEDGSSHQANEDIAIMRAIPDMRVIVPADAYETFEIIKCIAEEKGPFYVRMGRAKTPVIENRPKFQLGKGQVLKQGNETCIVACGIMVDMALQAACELKAKGMNITVVNMPTVKPIDKELLIALSESHSLFVACEEHSIIGGLGCAVSDVLSEVKGVIVKRIGIQDKFGQSGHPDQLLRHYGLTKERIVDLVSSHK